MEGIPSWWEVVCSFAAFGLARIIPQMTKECHLLLLYWPGHNWPTRFFWVGFRQQSLSLASLVRAEYLDTTIGFAILNGLICCLLLWRVVRLIPNPSSFLASAEAPLGKHALPEIPVSDQIAISAFLAQRLSFKKGKGCISTRRQ